MEVITLSHSPSVKELQNREQYVWSYFPGQILTDVGSRGVRLERQSLFTKTHRVRQDRHDNGIPTHSCFVNLPYSFFENLLTRVDVFAHLEERVSSGNHVTF